MTNLLLRGLYVVVLMTAADTIYALWAMSATSHHAIPAGVYATILIVLSGFVTRAYVDDRRMLLFAALGAFLGTYLPVRFL